MNKKNKNIFLAFILIAILLISGTFVYIEYYYKEEKTEEKPMETMVIDNRISPLENQGVVLEVLRIRHRGLLERLLKTGNSWEDTPSFYYITNMDGLEYTSKDVQQHGHVTEVFYTTWDTMGQESKVVKDVEEENETATITLSIVERVKSGLLGRKTSDIERDSFTVTYDFRSGRWSGDDNFKDYDGYGHYLGETFEIWFNIYQMDYDGDFIPYWTEVNILGTDPTVDDSKLDPDGDGIPTSWEWKWKYDPFTWDDHRDLDPDMDGLSNLQEYQMAKWFADPFIQDIYIEVDHMGKATGISGLFDPPHILYEESQQGIIERFAEHNIQVFFDDGGPGWANGPTHGGGDVLPHVDRISQDGGQILQYYTNYFPEERRGIFRYLVIGHAGGFSIPAVNNIYDCIYISNLLNYKLFPKIMRYLQTGWVPTERGNRFVMGSQLLHELAHSCSLDADNCDFEGIDNISGSWMFTKQSPWNQYKSSLNYMLMYHYVFDLSDGKNGPPYDQDDWSMIFPGFFKFNSELIEDPYYAPTGGKNVVESEWMVTNFTYDANLTEKFVKYIGDYSPVNQFQVNWSVYKLIDTEKNPNYKEIRVYAQPKIKTTQQWVLYTEGDLDSEGNMIFYSFDDILKEKIK